MIHKNLKPFAVRIERIIRADPHAVYRAWLDPHLVEQWMAPGKLEVTRVEIDERVGGRYRIWQGHSGYEGGGFECELAELVPDQRIVFRWSFVGPDRTSLVPSLTSVEPRTAGPIFDSILTITLEKTKEGFTVLTLVHERLEQLVDAMPEVAENVGIGWEMVIDRMAVVIGDDEA
jgi:uncharacterized protein YndB with AHSA1/START domain